MMEMKKCEIEALMRCENEECGGVTFKHEFEQNSWHCPFCGRSISKSEGQPNLPRDSLLTRGFLNRRIKMLQNILLGST